MNPRERSKQTKGKNRAEVLEPVFGDPKRSQLKILSVPPISPWLGRAAGPGGGSGVTRRHEGNTAFRHPALRFQITCHRWQGDVSNEAIQSERITAEMWKWPCEETRSNGNCQCTHACADGGRLLELPRGPQSHSLHSAEDLATLQRPSFRGRNEPHEVRVCFTCAATGILGSPLQVLYAVIRTSQKGPREQGSRREKQGT